MFKGIIGSQRIALLAASLAMGATLTTGQPTAARRPLSLNQRTFRLSPGESAQMPASFADVEFVRTAKVRSASMDNGKGLVFGPDNNGEIVLAASLLTPAGEYEVTISATSDTGEER